MIKNMEKTNPFEDTGIKEILLYMNQKPEGVKKNDFRTELGLASTTAIESKKVLEHLELIQPKQDDATIYILTEKGRVAADQIAAINEKVPEIDNLTGFGIIATLRYMAAHPDGNIKNNFRKEINLAPNTLDSVLGKLIAAKLVSQQDDTEGKTAGIFTLTPLGLEIYGKIQVCAALVGSPVVQVKEDPNDPDSEILLLYGETNMPTIKLGLVDFYQLVRRIKPTVITYSIKFEQEADEKDEENDVNEEDNIKISKLLAEYESENDFTFIVNHAGILYQTESVGIRDLDTLWETAKEMEMNHFQHHSLYHSAKTIGHFENEVEYIRFTFNWIEKDRIYDDVLIKGEIHYKEYVANKGFGSYNSFLDAGKYKITDPAEYKSFVQSAFYKLDIRQYNLDLNSLRKAAGFEEAYNTDYKLVMLQLFRDAKKMRFNLKLIYPVVEAKLLGIKDADEYMKFKDSGFMRFKNENIFHRESLETLRKGNQFKEYIDELQENYWSYKEMLTQGYTTEQDWKKAKKLGFTSAPEYFEFLKSGATNLEEYKFLKKLPELKKELDHKLTIIESDWKEYESKKDWSAAFQKAWTYSESLLKKQLEIANRSDLIGKGNESVMILIEKQSKLDVANAEDLVFYRKKRNDIIHESAKIDQNFYQKGKAFLGDLNDKLNKIPIDTWKKF